MGYYAELIVKRIRPLEYLNARDRYNLLDNDFEEHRNPKITNKKLLDLIYEQALRIGEKRIAWSGGIDSTLLVCVYQNLKIPFSVVCTKQSLIDGNYFYQYMKKQNFDIEVVDDYKGFKGENIVTGHSADTLFFRNFTRHKKVAEHFYGEGAFIVQDDIVEIVKEVADKKLNLKLNNEIDIFNFALIYYTLNATEWDMNISSNNPSIYTFLEHESFDDYAYTHFYEKQDLYKKVFRKHIVESTGDTNYYDDTKLFRKGYPTYEIGEYSQEYIQGMINKMPILGNVYPIVRKQCTIKDY